MKLTLIFNDPEDHKNTLMAIARAKKSPGTIAPLYCGLLCSALRGCEVGEVGEDSMIVIKELREAINHPEWSRQRLESHLNAIIEERL